jgi:hypothetical protein
MTGQDANATNKIDTKTSKDAGITIDDTLADASTINDILTAALEKEHVIAPRSSGVTPSDVVTKIITNILEKKKLPNKKSNRIRVGLSITTLAQEGASSPRFAETRICPLSQLVLKTFAMPKLNFT